MPNYHFVGMMNPLMWVDADPAPEDAEGVSADSFLAFLCADLAAVDPHKLMESYKEVSAVESGHLAIVPAVQPILEKVVFPLRHAKGAYVVGNYAGSIALSGMVSEMLTMLVYEMATIKVNGSDIDGKTAERLFGREFEKLPQERRIDVLVGYGLIDERMRCLFGDVKAIRNKYLHVFSHSHDQARRDALRAYAGAVELAGSVMRFEFDHGKVVFNQRLLNYMSRMGALRPVDPEPRIDGDTMPEEPTPPPGDDTPT